MKQIFFLILFIVLFTTNSRANRDVKKVFPLKNYPQHINFWFNENNKNYQTLYLSKEIQNLYFNLLKNNYYGNNSPWNKEYIIYLINPEPSTLKTIHKGEITISNNFKKSIYYVKENKNTIYGSNFRRLEISWIKNIIENMNLSQFEKIIYNPNNRAITVDRTTITALPSYDPIFNNYNIAGSGYPFNLNNLSIIPAGMPVYILGTSKDKGWYFIVSPGVMGWIKANKIAYVNKDFIKIWKRYANKGLANILTPDLSIIDTRNNYQFTSIAGTLLPIYKKYLNKLILMIPVKTSNNSAIIRFAYIPQTDASIVPLDLNMKNFAKVIKPLIGRPYGWGGINYYNDCSLELIAIYKAFGIFLPRNSASQVTYSGQTLDISKLSEEQRKEIIIKNSNPFTTLLYFKGHIMIYIGSYNTNYGEKTIMTYQNIWGLTPKDRRYRDIIGKAVIFPLLNKYPENPKNISLINKEDFILVNLIKPIDYKIGLSQLLY